MIKLVDLLRESVGLGDSAKEVFKNFEKELDSFLEKRNIEGGNDSIDMVKNYGIEKFIKEYEDFAYPYVKSFYKYISEEAKKLSREDFIDIAYKKMEADNFGKGSRNGIVGFGKDIGIYLNNDLSALGYYKKAAQQYLMNNPNLPFDDVFEILGTVNVVDNIIARASGGVMGDDSDDNYTQDTYYYYKDYPDIVDDNFEIYPQFSKKEDIPQIIKNHIEKDYHDGGMVDEDKIGDLVGNILSLYPSHTWDFQGKILNNRLSQLGFKSEEEFLQTLDSYFKKDKRTQHIPEEELDYIELWSNSGN